MIAPLDNCFACAIYEIFDCTIDPCVGSDDVNLVGLRALDQEVRTLHEVVHPFAVGVLIPVLLMAGGLEVAMYDPDPFHPNILQVLPEIVAEVVNVRPAQAMFCNFTHKW